MNNNKNNDTQIKNVSENKCNKAFAQSLIDFFDSLAAKGNIDYEEED